MQFKKLSTKSEASVTSIQIGKYINMILPCNIEKLKWKPSENRERKCFANLQKNCGLGSSAV